MADVRNKWIQQAIPICEEAEDRLEKYHSKLRKEANEALHLAETCFEPNKKEVCPRGFLCRIHVSKPGNVSVSEEEMDGLLDDFILAAEIRGLSLSGTAILPETLR